MGEITVIAPGGEDILIEVPTYDVVVEAPDVVAIDVQVVGAPGPPGEPGEPGVAPPEADENLSCDFGNTAAAGGSYNTVIGAQAAAGGAGAYVLGCRATASGVYAGAFGYGSYAPGAEAIALGHNTQALLAGAVAIGTDDVGVGAVAPNTNDFVLGTAKHRIQVPGKFSRAVDIDAGPGAGVPLIVLRTNNGTQVISSDGSSYTTFSNGVIFPVLFTGGLGFTAAGAQIDMNQGSVVQAKKFTTTAADGHVRNYSDYNAGQPVTSQGFIHAYDNGQAGGPPQAAFHVEKNGDPSVQPFLVSANGYGWYRCEQPDKPVLVLRGASGQTAPLLLVEDVTSTAKLTLTTTGLTCPVAATFSDYVTGGTFVQNNAPTDANHLTRKDYVDGRIWSGTQAEYDAIVTKDPNVLYVVV